MSLTPMHQTLHHLADDDTVDAMTFILAVSLATATVELTESGYGWGNPPRLAVVIREDHGKHVGVRISELPLPDVPEGKAIDPMLLLEVAAEMMAITEGHLPPTDIVGWMFVSEAWMLQGTGDQEEAFKKIAEEKLVHADPDATECRVVVLADRAGRLYQTLTQRDSDDEPTMMVTGPGGNSIADGRIIGALQHLVDVTPVGT